MIYYEPIKQSQLHAVGHCMATIYISLIILIIFACNLRICDQAKSLLVHQGTEYKETMDLFPIAILAVILSVFCEFAMCKRDKDLYCGGLLSYSQKL